ncbi:MAG: substrate-binding domain-containing protein [Pseudomonadota bacterium]
MTSTALKIICAGLALLLAGCGDQKPQQRLVAFSQANNAEPYRATQKALMEKLFAGSPDTKLVVSDAQQDNSKQIAQIETFIRQKPSVLIVAPNERAALTAVMGKAMQAGIPVICLERDILEPNYTTYIRMDNKAIGRLAGQFIVDQLTKKYGTPKGNVVMLRGLLGVEAEINRDGGAREILNRYPQIHVVADPVADWIQAQAKDRMTEVLRVQPQIDVVYGHNDPMAVGAYLAAKELGREKEMLFIGVDGLGGPSGGIKKVVDGVLAATFVYPLGVKEAVEVAQKIIKDPSYKPDKEITLSSTMVTPENAADLYQKLTVATD